MVNGILKIDAIYNTKAARQPRKDPCKAKIGNSRNLDYLPCFSYYRKMNTISVIYGKFYSEKCVLKIRTRTTPKFCCTVASCESVTSVKEKWLKTMWQPVSHKQIWPSRRKLRTLSIEKNPLHQKFRLATQNLALFE